MNYALIFAGGTGQRMNSKSIPKQFLIVHNKPILIHTVEKFSKCKDINGIVIVCYGPWVRKCEKMLKQHNVSKVIKVVNGGENGQESIYNGLVALNEVAKSGDIVLIHDGVRPLIQDKVIKENISTVKTYGNAITSSKAIETIITAENGEANDILDRQCCFYARAPQSFIFDDIYKCHVRSRDEGLLNFIDSASMMKHYGYTLHTVECGYDNIKITTPIDFFMFKGILDARENQQLKDIK